LTRFDDKYFAKLGSITGNNADIKAICSKTNPLISPLQQGGAGEYSDNSYFQFLDCRLQYYCTQCYAIIRKYASR